MYVGFQGPHEPWNAPDTCSEFDTNLLPDPIPELPQESGFRTSAAGTIAGRYPELSAHGHGGPDAGNLWTG